MSLFQNSVQLKYLNQIDSKLLDSKYNEFKAYFGNPEIQENIRNSKEEQFQEGFLRELFVKILGYTLNPSANFNLTTEYKNIKDSKKADGAIIINDTVKAVIELKGTDTIDLSKIETQAFGYKNNQPDCIYVITSNFEKLRFYIDNAIEHIEFNLFSITKQEFQLLYLCLSFSSIEKNIPKKIKDESVSKEDDITKKLYQDYSLFKRELHRNLVALNPQFDALTLFKKSQKLLDRFLFLFFAEDRQLLPPNSVRLVLNDWKELQERDEMVPLYDRFKKYFGYLNIGFKGKRYDVFAYNGGLFLPDEVLDNIKIEDDLLFAHTWKLSEYNFASEVDVNILGHIFENSLNELEEINAQLEGKEIDKSKTKRKKDGVFYTPKYITKYIVDNTVGRLCAEKKAELQINDEDYKSDKKRQAKTKQALVDKLKEYRNWLLQITICDPACGSGAFLNQALDFLINEHRYIDELQAKLFGDSIVFTDIRKSILENNIFGVDINEESVEIAKLALWLRTAEPNRKLNDLNNNIKCGNSLIDDPTVAGDKAFNWQKEFPKVFVEKEKKAWHITTATHNSRYSQRMFDNHVKLGEPVWLSEQEEIIVTQTIADIVKNDRLNILAYNICGDHMHILLVCEETEVPEIMGKLKSMSARACNIEMGRTIPTEETRGHVPLSSSYTIAPSDSTTVPLAHTEKGITQAHLWTQKFGCKEITSGEQLNNTIAYIQNNRNKHELPEIGKLQTLVDEICCTYEHAFHTEYTGGFDVVIGNPPYGAELGLLSKNYLNDNYISFKGNNDIYSAFLQLAFQLITKKGFWGFINPVSWQSNESYIDLRRYLKENGILQIAIKLPYNVFADAYIDTGIYIAKKQFLETYDSFVYEFPVRTSLSNITLQFIELKKLSSSYWNQLDSLKIVLNPVFYELLPKLIKNTQPLAIFTESIRGILPNESDVTFYEQPDFKSFFIGNLYRYELQEKYAWVKYGENLKERPKDYNWFTNERLLVRRLINRQFRVMASISKTEFVNKKDIYIIKSINSSINLYYLLAIINSSLISFLKTKGSTTATKDDFSQLTLNDIREIPIKRISEELQKPFIEKADQMLSLNKDLQETSQKFQHTIQRKFNLEELPGKLQDWYLLTYSDFIKELGKKKIKLSLSDEAEWETYFIEEQKKALEIKTKIETTDKEIDQMVYKLYELTDDEIKTIENTDTK